MNAEILASVESEEAILGCVLINASIYPLTTLQPGDFFIHRWGWVWAAFRNLHKKEMGIDFLTVTEELDSMEKLAQVGGVAEISKLLNAVPTSINWESYETIIKDKSTRRNHLETANFIAHGAHNGGVDVGTAIDMLSSVAIDNKGRLISGGVSDLYDTVGERAKDPKDIWGIPTGFIDLDKMTGGLHYQQNTMISGDPGVGKTTIMLQIALQVALAGHGVAIFEAEMDEQRCIRRLVELYTKGKVTNRMMITGRIPDEAWSIFIHATEQITALNIYINDDPGISTTDIRAEVMRQKAERKIDLVCLDYLDLLSDIDGDGRSSNANAAIKAKRFRQVIRETKTAGLSIQDMTKSGMEATTKELHHMSGPSKIHYGADNIFFMTKSDTENAVYRLLGAKQRDGDTDMNSVALVRNGLGFESATAATFDLSMVGRKQTRKVM